MPNHVTNRLTRKENTMPKWRVSIRRICTDYDYAYIEIEAETAEQAAELCNPGEEQFDRALKDAEFRKEEVVDTEYEVDHFYEITQVEDQDEPSL